VASAADNVVGPEKIIYCMVADKVDVGCRANLAHPMLTACGVRIWPEGIRYVSSMRNCEKIGLLLLLLLRDA
jgi:hypothetical protein